ncbi:KH domain-containing protein [Rothia sp. AR01]|uniref:KH domain-containing protein n=1 Tax=Rothia santali TaxID=2949643 RepID=A0A9X2HC26_9MICC|nr:R3H domain-containing nucleic acid-binding protein [Rothia santali]MCP3425520.1 KH domain-containing protein [Rothia santali]
MASEQPAADGQSADGQSSDERAADGAASGSEAAAASSSEPTPAGSAGESAPAEEDESEIAADYLEELLDIADLDGDIDIEIRQNRTYLSVVAEGDAEEELSLLVGRHGEVLDALQELVRLAVLAATGHRSRLILDVAGHREQREGELKVLAEKALESVRTTGEPYHLKPLGSYERKMVHDIVAEHGMHSASEGEGSRRHIVVSPYQAPVEDRSGADA